MPTYLRTYATTCYFFTLVTENRQPLLADPIARACLRHAIQNVRQTQPFTIEAWVLLPDHLHAIWSLPDADRDYSKRRGRIKAAFSKRMNQEADWVFSRSESHQKRRESGLWQRRFWEHAIRDQEDFKHHMDYLHFNPVKHGYVNRVCDWPYSTFHRWVKHGWYSRDWGGEYTPSNIDAGE